jgi:hypothetical protein
LPDVILQVFAENEKFEKQFLGRNLRTIHFRSKAAMFADESVGEPHAVQTLRAIRERSLVAKRLDCGCFSTAFRQSQTAAPAK